VFFDVRNSFMRVRTRFNDAKDAFIEPMSALLDARKGFMRAKEEV
jgi:hypothetical protein